MMIKSIHELLTEVVAENTTEAKIAKLQSFNNQVLQKYLQLALDPNIKFALPKGKMSYKPSDFPDTHGKLYLEARRMYLFVEGGHPTLDQKKRENLFLEILETCQPEDAKFLVAMKDKKVPYKGITYSLVAKAFPGLLPDTDKTSNFTTASTEEKSDA